MGVHLLIRRELPQYRHYAVAHVDVEGTVAPVRPWAGSPGSRVWVVGLAGELVALHGQFLECELLIHDGDDKVIFSLNMRSAFLKAAFIGFILTSLIVGEEQTKEVPAIKLRGPLQCPICAGNCRFPNFGNMPYSPFRQNVESVSGCL